MLHELWFITNLFGHFSVYVSVVFVFLRLHFVIIIINNNLSAREKKDYMQKVKCSLEDFTECDTSIVTNVN